MHILLILVIIAAAVSPVIAKEFNVLGGVIKRPGENGTSYSGQMEYLERPFLPGAISVSYLNEGHLSGDHQDGYLLQLWAYAPLQRGKFSLALGAGPYFYFNTSDNDCRTSYCNTHGVGLVTSAAMTMEGEGGWLFHLRTNWARTGHSDSVSTLIGLGYRFDSSPPTGKPQQAKLSPLRNQVTLLAGQTTVNSKGSEHALAFGLEYRRRLLPYLEGTIGLLHEGETSILRRSGATSQLWVVRDFLDDSLSLGIGAGGYLAADHHSGHRVSERFSGIVTMTAGYRFDEHWLVRLNWNRVLTGYDGDTDVIMGGIGYAF